MYATLASRDLGQVLDLIRAMNEVPEGGFLPALLTGMASLVRCDTVSYNEHDPSTGRERRYLIEPRYTPRTTMDAAYHQYLGQHPIVDAVFGGRLAPGRSVTISDLMSGPAYRQLPLYREYFRIHEVEDQLAVLINAGRTSSRLMVLSRSRRGFSARDRAALEVLAPHVRQAIRYRSRISQLRATVGLQSQSNVAESAWGALTPRERDVIGSLGSGASDRVIGRVLGISERTVGKHLENIYQKLGVSGRAALVAATRHAPA